MIIAHFSFVTIYGQRSYKGFTFENVPKVQKIYVWKDKVFSVVTFGQIKALCEEVFHFL